MEAAKNIYCAKSEGAVDPSKVIREFKKFRSGCKHLNDQSSSGRPKTVDSETVLQITEANLEGSTPRVSGELVSHSSVWLVTFTISANAFKAAKLWLMYYQNIAKL